MLHSVKLNLGWKILGGQIPTTVWLANPFSCAIGLRKLSLRVYAQPSADSVLLGWVSMPDLDRRGRRRDSDDSTRYSMPELLPPYSHMDMASVFYFRNTSIPGVNDTETLMREETPRYVFKLNMGGLVLDSKDALRQLASSLKQRQFIVSAAVDDLQVRIGRFEWRMTNITEHDLVNLPLFPRHVVEKVGWPRLFRSLFGDGWVMVDDEANVFKPPPPRESLTTTIVGTMPLPTLGPEES